MHRIRFAILAAASLGAQGAAATPPLDASALTTPLGCQIRDYKVVVVTNTTGQTIPAGTRISYVMIRDPDGRPLADSFISGTMAPGASVQIGGVQSSSCTASMRRVMVMAP